MAPTMNDGPGSIRRPKDGPVSKVPTGRYTHLNARGPASQDERGPFGGFKQSGFGRNLGYEGVIQFQGYHSISGPAGGLV